MRRFLLFVPVALLLLARGPAADEPSPLTLPVVLKRVEPEPPALFRNNSVEGRVSLMALIGIDGSVVKLETRSCDTRRPGEKEFSVEPRKQCAPFEEAVRKAAAKWKYTPGSQGGRPVETWVGISMSFARPGSQISLDPATWGSGH